MGRYSNYNCVVVGAGFSGATAARLLADKGFKVLIIEERNHIGGNSYDCLDEHGVLIHPHGPHIFHTSEKRVFDFLTRFTAWNDYKHKVLGNIDGKLVPIPFNFKSIEICFGLERAKVIERELINEFPRKDKVSIFELVSSNNETIKEFGDFVYEKVFAHYTAKQWGTSIDSIDKSVINRVPVMLNYSDYYFSDEYQYMPKDGFGLLFEKMLDSNTIDIVLNKKFESIFEYKNNCVYIDGEEYKGIVIFTGQLDRLFKYKYGNLPYRSLLFKFESYPLDSYQESAVVNYNTHEEFTRITEFKKLTNQVIEGKTTILKEYPSQFDYKKEMVPYYPISNSDNIDLYLKYFSIVKKIPNLYCCGRLAEYKYYNMDKAISRAMDIVEEILRK